MIMRTCTQCKTELPLTEFTKHKKEPDGIRKYCRGCANAQKRAWYKRNYVKGSDYYKKVQVAGQKKVESGLNAIKCREQYEKHKVKRTAELKAYQLANPEKVTAWKKAYKHRKRAAVGTYTIEQLQGRIDYYGAKCWICSADYEAIDHVKPLSKGGTNWPANLRPICNMCNRRKAAKWPLDKVFA